MGISRLGMFSFGISNRFVQSPAAAGTTFRAWHFLLFLVQYGRFLEKCFGLLLGIKMSCTATTRP